jgi:hypothetical protein
LKRRDYSPKIGHFYFGILGHYHFGGTFQFFRSFSYQK